MTDQAVRLQSNGPYWIACWYDSRGKRCRKSIGAKSKLSKLAATRLCKDMEIRHAIKPARRDLGRTPHLMLWLDWYIDLRDDLGDSTRVMHRETSRYLLEFFGDEIQVDGPFHYHLGRAHVPAHALLAHLVSGGQPHAPLGSTGSGDLV